MTLPVILENPEKKEVSSIEVNSMLDTGSDSTLVTEELASVLRLKGQAFDLNLQGVSNTKSTIKSALVDIKIRSFDGKISKVMKEVQVIPSITEAVRARDWTKYLTRLGLPSTPPIGNGNIGLLIGQDNADLLLTREYQEGSESSPIAVKTWLGWTCMGLVKRKSSQTTSTLSAYAEAMRSRPKHKVHGGSDRKDIELDKESLFELQPEDLIEIGANIFTSTREANPQIRSLHEELKNLWTHDNYPSESSTMDDEHCRKILLNSYKIENGRAIIDPLFKVGQPEKGLNNYFYAKKRLDGLIRQLSKDDRGTVNRLFEEYLESGIFEEVKVEHPHLGDAIYWSHFVVRQPKSETTPVRPVMDGAAKHINNPNGAKISINEKLYHAGPNIMCSLPSVLMRFRQYNSAFTGDISKMFLKVLVPKKYRKYSRVLWLSPEGKLRVFQFTGHLFGCVGSPTCAMYAVQRNAYEHRAKFPRAAECVLKSTIVDDHLDSCPTSAETLKLIKDLVTIHKIPGLKIAKFTTNDPVVFDNLPSDISSSETMKDFSKWCTGQEKELAPGTESKVPTMRALGQYWQTPTDLMTYSGYEPDHRIQWTKLYCLSQAAKPYDPTGYAIPVLLASKLFIQALWKRGAAWLDPLTSEELKEWKQWMADVLPHMPLLQFPRVIKKGFPEDFKSVQLHVFSDASKVAFAAVAYIRMEYTNGSFYTNFVMAKGKINPINPSRTIPKLELMGVALAVSLSATISEALEIKRNSVFIWTDSKTALQWIRMPLGHLQVLPHNYCKKIQEGVENLDHVRWVAGIDNPADYPTRPKTVKELAELPNWTVGPEFLRQKPDLWPKIPTLDAAEAKSSELLDGVKKEHKIFAFNSISSKVSIGLDPFDMTTYSSYQKLEKKFAYVVHYMGRLIDRVRLRRNGVIPDMLVSLDKKQSRNKANKFVLSVSDIREAKLRLVYYHQINHFSTEREMIGKKGIVPLTNKLAKLTPNLVANKGFYLNEPFCLLRLGARLQVAKHLNQDARMPFLLHPRDNFTTLFVQHNHAKILSHVGGIKCLQAEINRSSWIVGSLNHVKRILRECVICRKARPKKSTNQMAPLPDFRIPSEEDECPAAFTVTTFDVAGPWLSSQGPGYKQQKRYLLLFRCAMYGAVYTEMLHSMTAQSFLAALLRFQANHRIPLKIISDNGTNFVGGKNDLSHMWDEISQDELKSERLDIEWIFTPPYNPHQNGLIERMVGEVKKSLKTVLDNSNRLINDELLETCFKAVQGFLNDRPLVYWTNDQNDCEALTPNHFMLKGKIAADLAPIKHYSSSPKDRYKAILSIVHEFWLRFVREMGPKLHSYNKWVTKRTNIQVGDIVAVLEDRPSKVGPMSRYPLGRIVKIFPGRDGIPRKAEIKTKEFRSVPLVRGLNRLYVVLPASDIQAGSSPKGTCPGNTASMQPKILSIEEEIPEEYRPSLTRKRKGKNNKSPNLIDFPGKNTRSAVKKKHIVLFGVEQCDYANANALATQ
jgi:transposase InsO family protein